MTSATYDAPALVERGGDEEFEIAAMIAIGSDRLDG